MSEEIQIRKLTEQLNNELLASYFVGRYYFKVYTKLKKSDLGYAENEMINLETQRNVQQRSIVSMFHEYIHYIHEISTVVGNFQLALDVSLKSIFSHYFDKNLNSSEHHGLDFSDKLTIEKFSNLHTSIEVLNGNIVQNARIVRINKINYKTEKLFAPNEQGTEAINIRLPFLRVDELVMSRYIKKEYVFGKFFIYEGLAYELDRMIHKQVNELNKIVDQNNNTEYTVLRKVARFLYPGIETEIFLIVASLSLSYVDCGNMFISFIDFVRKEIQSKKPVDEVIAKLKTETGKMLLKKQADFNDAQDEIVKVFEKRSQLHKAFFTIAQQAKNSYQLRCESPSFEVDLIKRGQFRELLNLVPVCDYMYVFEDEEEFQRDLLGTASFDDSTSQSLKILIAYDHYQKSHQVFSTNQTEVASEFKCPFFSTCSLSLRLSHEHICRTKPWRVFEISQNGDKLFCWYGQAVGEFKGHNEHSA